MSRYLSNPVIVWDVDGVLNPSQPGPGHVPHPYGGPGPDGTHVTGTVWLNPEHGKWIAELTAAGATHAWASSWGRLAATWIALRLGYPKAARWPVIDVGAVHAITFGHTAKGQQVLPFLGDRPAFWVDDLFGGKDELWAEDRTAAGIPTVVRPVTSPAGLTRADIDAALAWLDDVRRPGMLLAGTVGSVAYGLDNEASDIDRLGVFAAPTEAILGLHPPAASNVTTKPDAAYHEAAKAIGLLLRCNPTLTELLWLPGDLYQVRAPLGDQLIGIRGELLSREYTRHAFLDYAVQQFRQLKDRGDGSFSADTRKRTAKHARHLARLLTQGRGLYTEGRLTVRLADPQKYLDFGEQVAAGDLDAARAALTEAETVFDTARSPLREHPDDRAAEEWLLDVRRAFYPRCGPATAAMTRR